MTDFNSGIIQNTIGEFLAEKRIIYNKNYDKFDVKIRPPMTFDEQDFIELQKIIVEKIKQHKFVYRFSLDAILLEKLIGSEHKH